MEKLMSTPKIIVDGPH